MTTFELDNAGNSEAQQKLGMAWLLRQVSRGIARTGVLQGFEITQTSTPSDSVLIDAGAGAVQASVLAGVSLLVNDTMDDTFEILTSNPMGALPRKDIVVFNALTQAFDVRVGVPNASPADPTVLGTDLPLARVRHAANATTIPNSAIDDLRTFTALAGAPNRGPVRDVTLSASGTWTVTHGLGSTPAAVVCTAVGFGGAGDDYSFRIESRSSTNFVVVVYRNGVIATAHAFPAGYGFDWVAVP